MLIGVDFDGTCVEHAYPEIGRPVPGAVKWLKTWQAAGATLILWTMRDRQTSHGDTLTPALAYLQEAGVQIVFANDHPGQTWTGSRKLYAHVYVDDMALGCPLKTPKGRRAFVDWSVVGPAVLTMVKNYCKDAT